MVGLTAFAFMMRDRWRRSRGRGTGLEMRRGKEELEVPSVLLQGTAGVSESSRSGSWY